MTALIPGTREAIDVTKDAVSSAIDGRFDGIIALVIVAGLLIFGASLYGFYKIMFGDRKDAAIRQEKETDSRFKMAAGLQAVAESNQGLISSHHDLASSVRTLDTFIRSKLS